MTLCDANDAILDSGGGVRISVIYRHSVTGLNLFRDAFKVEDTLLAGSCSLPVFNPELIEKYRYIDIQLSSQA